MTSTRLPGKVLRPVMGRPLLAYEIDRLKLVRTPHILVVATTDDVSDDPIEKLAEGMSCVVYRGARDDVLRRYSEAARHVGAQTVVRITADCPLIDPSIVELVIQRYRDEECDFASNMLEWTFPLGLAVEVFSRDALETADREAAVPEEREHVTVFIYRRPERFRLCSIRLPQDLSRHRWTVDTLADFQLVSQILESLHPLDPTFSMNDVLELMDKHPEWAGINRDADTYRPDHPLRH